jgi:GNAT superfamily N-acetyltransferase
MTAFRITKGYRPGAIGRVAQLHGEYYHRHWDFGLFFEAKVATELSAFLSRCDERRDGFWVALADDRVEGAIVIDGQDAQGEGAHLRWFIVADGLRGRGAGNRLMETAMDFCRRKGYPGVYLWTFEGLTAARHLYEKHGFVLTEQHRGAQWGVTVNEQRFVWSARTGG